MRQSPRYNKCQVWQHPEADMENPISSYESLPPIQRNSTEIHTNINYVGGDDHEQNLDLYLPIENNFPTLILIHGGAWRAGNKEMYVNVGTWLQSKGIGCAVINYRLTPRVTFPTHIQDCARSVLWVKNNIIKYGGNGKMFLAGHSAGGHLASLLVADPKYLKEVEMTPGEFSGVIGMSGIYLINYNVNFYGAGSVFRQSNKANCSPLNHVTKDMPPFLIYYAEKDVPTFEKQSKNFAAALSKVGIKTKAIMCEKNTHINIIDILFSNKSKHEAEIMNFIKNKSI